MLLSKGEMTIDMCSRRVSRLLHLLMGYPNCLMKLGDAVGDGHVQLTLARLMEDSMLFNDSVTPLKDGGDEFWKQVWHRFASQDTATLQILRLLQNAQWDLTDPGTRKFLRRKRQCLLSSKADEDANKKLRRCEELNANKQASQPTSTASSSKARLCTKITISRTCQAGGIAQ